MKKKAARIGRPPKKTDEKQRRLFGIKVTDSQYAELMEAGGSDWARDVLLKAARRKR